MLQYSPMFRTISPPKLSGIILSKLINSFRRYSLGWICLLFIILPLLAFPEIVLGRQTLYWTDLSWIHYPRHVFAAEEWWAGRVPLWDPYEDTGIPFLAESQVSVLYPVSVLFLSPLSPALELSLFIMVHFSLAALFTFSLGRLLGLNRPAATLAALAFGFGGFLMAQVANLNIMTGAVWLPAILAGVIITTRQRGWLVAMLAGVPVAMQIFTAQPQIVFYTMVTLLGYGLYRIGADFFSDQNPPYRNSRYALRTAALLAVLVLTGLLLAAPQLLPTLELQQLSVRSQERGLSFLTENSLPPIMWLNLLIPSVFGNNVTGFKGGDPFQEVFVYIGFVPLVLALIGLGSLLHPSQKPAGDRLFFGWLLVGAVLLAMGSYTPLYEYVIQYLPGFSLFRIPSRWLMGVNLALAILAGIGLDTLRDRGITHRQLRFLGLAAFLLGGTIIVLGWFGSDWLQQYGGRLNEFYGRLAGAFLDKAFHVHPIYQDRLLLHWVAGLNAPAFLLLTNILLMVGLFVLGASQRIKPANWTVLVPLITAIDLIIAGGTAINPTRPEQWWQQLSGGALYVLDNVGQARVFPLGMGSEAAAVSHLGQYFPSVYRVHSAGGHGSSLRLARYDTFLHEADPVQALRVLGVRYLLTLGQMGADVATTYPLVYNDETSFVYENQKALPRAFVVHRVIRVNSSAECLSYFQSRTIDPANTVILETDNIIPDPVIPETAASSTATISGQNPQALEIKVRLAADGYLVLLDTFYPGWQANIDGQITPIYRANYIGRAVFVPGGEHIIRFEYKPLSFKIGQGVALLGLVVITVTAFFSWPVKRPDQPEPR